MNVADDLVSWAESRRNRGPKAEFAKEVADALRNPEDRTKWSLIDLRREFDARSASSSPLAITVNSIAGFAFILPVFLAWFHLRGVFAEFRDAVRIAGASEQINFLAFWTGAYDGEPWAYDGMSASTVALLVLISVLVVLGLQFAAGAIESRESLQDRELNSLITAASLSFARDRAIRPEELAGEIRIAAQELERGLMNLTTAFENTRALVEEVEQFAGVITASANNLSKSSEVLATTMDPLNNFATTAKSADQTLAQAVIALGNAERAFAQGTQGNAAIIAAAHDVLTKGVSENARALNVVTDSVNDAASVMKAATNGLANVVDSSIGISSSVAETTRELRNTLEGVRQVAVEMREAGKANEIAANTFARVAESADSSQVETYVIAVRAISESMERTADEIANTVEHLSTQLQKWNENGR